MIKERLLEQFERKIRNARPYLNDRTILALKKELLLDWLMTQDEGHAVKALETARAINDHLNNNYHEGNP
jgi:hypothetical protein